MNQKIWHVTTQGDCEGRTTRNLGFHVGDVTVIAFNLAKESYYSLEFKEIKVVNHDCINDMEDLPLKVTISGFGVNRSEYTDNNFVPPDYDVVRSNMYNSLDIVLKKNSIQEKIKKARAKLTKEELELLGL